MKKMQIASLFFLSFFTILIQSVPPQEYKPTTSANLTQNLEKLTYSHNQRLLVGFKNQAEGEFLVFDGLKLNNMKIIPIDDQIKERVSPSTFAYSKNDDLLIVGSKEGGIYGFKITNNTIDNQYQYNFVVGTKTQQNWIRAISISAQNKIAISAKTTIIILETQQDTGKFIQKIRYNFAHTIYALQWSVLQPNIVFVGTRGSSQGEFSRYDIQKNTIIPINKDKIESLAIFPDANMILKGSMGKNVQIYTYQVGTVPVLIDTIKDTYDTNEISVSQNGLYFALQTNSGQIKAYNVQNEGTFLNLKNQQTLIFYEPLLSLNKTGRSFALSSSGSDIIIIPSDGSAQVSKYSLCQNKQYFNKQTQTCQVCSQNCNKCFNNQTCITCNIDKFISGDECKPCGSKLDGCLTCSNEEFCLTCDEDEDWKTQAKDGKCQCKDTFYNNNGACSTCSMFLDCKNCAGPNNCTQCKDEGNFNTQPQNGLCICKPSFWLNQTQCKQCSQSIPDCELCSQDGTKCNHCQSPDRKPNTQQSQCVCVDYKYEDQQTKKCQFCDTHQNCVSCQTQSPNKCLTCDTNKHFQFQAKDGICICEATYFNDDEKCSLCSDFILECQLCNNKDECLVCKNENNFDTIPVDGRCVCIEKWTLVEQECRLCSELIVGCSTCSSLATCTACDENAHFDKTPVNQKCKCMAQYWLNNTMCQLCSFNIKGCSTCSEDGAKCLICQDQSRQPSQDGQSCECKPFYYENQQDNTCQPCDSKHSCVQCQVQNDHKCIECDTMGHWNSTIINGQCQCMDGYNQYDGKCIFCMVLGCTVCPSQTECKQCSQEKKFKKDSINNECKCKAGTRLSENRQQCIDCNLTIIGCKQCSNKYNCQICDTENHFVIDSTNDICLCDQGWYLKDNKCENCSLAIDNCQNCSIVNTDVVQCNKCEKGYGKTAKNLCISCKLASTGCIDCDQSNKCTMCDQENGFALNGTKCICIKGFFLKNDQCVLCSSVIPGCDQCDDDKTCTSCNSTEMFIPTPNAQHKCDCIEKWTLNQEKCTKCSIIAGCMTCSDIETCTQCDENNNFQLTQDKKCQCKKGYWIDQTFCKQCNVKIPGCLTCSQDGSICQKCSDPNRVVNDKKDECICQQFMFQNQEKQCQFCDQDRNCKECTQKDNCTICDINKKWIQIAVEGKCMCQKGYQQWNNQCLLCEVSGCSQCHQENYCYKCESNKKFNEQPIDGKCQCKQSTHLDGDQCYYCGQKLIGCEQCVNLQECTVCNDKNYFVLNDITKKCQCDSNHYFVSLDCIACSYAIDYCSECKIDNQTKQCLTCQKGYIIDTDNNTNCLKCQQLIVGCSLCIDNKTCTECNQEGNFQSLQNKCVCKKGFFLQQIECEQCSKPLPGCMECDQNGQKCSLCDQKNNFKLIEQIGKCQCIKGYYLNDHQCNQCSTVLTGCKQCQRDGSECIVCQDGFYLIEGKCLSCSSNIPGCTKCSVDGQQCSQCSIQHFTLNQITHQCDCQQTYFLKDSQCKLCSSQLLSCNKCTMNGKQCIQCMGDHFILNNQSKLCQCQSTYYIYQNSTCQLCSQVITGCSKCDQQGSKCSECKQEQKFIIDNDSSCSCIDGFYLNKTQKQCNLCSTSNPGCTKCSTDGKQSLQCNMSNFVLDKQHKKCQCIEGYFIASSTQCKLCSQSIQFCQICSSQYSSYVQTSSIPRCTECLATFTLNNQGTKCLCQGENKQVINGLCKEKQQPTNWIFYAAIAGGVIIVIVLCIFIYLKIKRSKLVKLDSYNQLDDENHNTKSAKPQTILTDNSADKISFNPSVYRLQDQE